MRSITAGAKGHDPAARLRHAHRPAFWRAVACFAVLTGRWDAGAVLAGLGELARVQAEGGEVEPDMQRILDMLGEFGVTVLGVDEDQVRYALRGETHDPVSVRKIADMLLEGREVEGLPT